MLVKEMKFRDIDKHYFFIENINCVKKIYKKLHLKKEIHPILVYGFIDHEKGITFRILGNVIIENDISKLEDEFIKNTYILEYDFLENYDMKEVPENVAFKIVGVSAIENEIDSNYKNTGLLKSRNNEQLDQYRDIRLIDDVQFLLLSREAQEEDVWARIDEEEENGLLKCTLLDDVNSKFNLKKNDKIYIKYVEHPKSNGLMFVRKI